LLTTFWVFPVRALIRRFRQNSQSSKLKASENQLQKANLALSLAGIVSSLYLIF
jgi:hypothetical protein